MDSIWDSNLREFRDKAASREPTPGGGSVAAVVAAEGLALVLMALEVSSRRKDFNPEVVRFLEQGKGLMEPLSLAADEDIFAFNKYLEAVRMPKNSAAEMVDREKALAEASARAMEAPLRAAERCLEALALAREAVRLVHAGIASDVGAGAALIHGALTAILYNVDINVKSITSPPYQQEALMRRKDFQRRGDELAYVIGRETMAKIVR